MLKQPLLFVEKIAQTTNDILVLCSHFSWPVAQLHKYAYCIFDSLLHILFSQWLCVKSGIDLRAC